MTSLEIFVTVVVYLVSGLPLLKIVQIKEYFFPSIWAHFDYPSSWQIFFRRSEMLLLFLWSVLVLLAVVGINFYLYENDVEAGIYIQPFDLWLRPFFSGYVVLGLLLGVLFLKRRSFLQSFQWTPKFLFINLLVLIINLRLLQYAVVNSLDYIQAPLALAVFLLTKLGQFPIVLFATYLANLITKIYALFLYNQAGQKIKQYKKLGLKVIGITGSYGKSSTKELLGQLLETKYKVLRSPARLNAEIGLAQFVLRSNLDKVDYLVLEMGARAVGEIETLVKIFEPEIIYLTGLAPQHLATFGSIENIVKAKLEIFGSLLQGQSSGLAILNGNDEFVIKIYKELNLPRKYLYASSGAAAAYPQILENLRVSQSHFYSKDEVYELANLSSGPVGSQFTFVYPAGEIRLKTNLSAPHQVENLIAALTGCYLIGAKLEELRVKMQNLELLPHSYQILQHGLTQIAIPRIISGQTRINTDISRPLIIDDSYNANLVGAQKGAEYFLSLPLKTKIIIFAGILELGPETSSYYKELIEAFKKADRLLLTFADFTEVFLENLSQAQIINNEEEFAKVFQDFNEENAGILILGRVPRWVLEVLERK